MDRQTALRDPERVTRAMDRAACRKAGDIPGWAPYLYQSTKAGLAVTGCMTRPKKSGPNKGEPVYMTRNHRRRVLITARDVDRELAELADGAAA